MQVFREPKKYGIWDEIKAHISILIKNLNHLDPMPWNQAILFGFAFGVMFLMVIIGSLHP